MNYCTVYHYYSGSFCPSKTETPTKCASGTYTEIEGASMATDCKVCPAGYYCPEGTEYPEACPAGDYYDF